MAKLKSFFRILVVSGKQWNNDQATTLSAALAYYTAFSIAPLIVIAIAMVGFFFGTTSSTGEIYSTIEQLLGPTGARGVESLVQSAISHPSHGKIAAILGTVTLILGASGVFVQLQQSLDLIWRVQARSDRTIAGFLRQRVVSFSMVVVIGFILLVSLLVTAAISAVETFAVHLLPLKSGAFWHLLNIVASLGVSTLLFALIYKILPDVNLRLRDVIGGAFLTALLFSAGKTAIGLYLGHSGTASSYGAAGSFAVVMLWVYYSSLIFYYGAEFTRASVLKRKKVQCKSIAEPIAGFGALSGSIELSQLREESRKSPLALAQKITMHPLHEVNLGERFPELTPVIIEVPKGSKVKYELDNYKVLENKPVKVEGVGSRKEALQILESARERYDSKKNGKTERGAA